MDRRSFLMGVGALASLPSTAAAQQAGEVPRVGIFLFTPALKEALVVPVHVGAECALVLWENQLVPGPQPHEAWVIRTATPDRQACKAVEEQRIREKLGVKPPSADAQVNRFRNEVNAPAGTWPNVRLLWSYTIICLPDTTDPRGPKGGGR